MKWTKETPTKVGTYFRNNPPASHMTRQTIIEIDGMLWIASNNQGAASYPLHHLHGPIWWYGPIPALPDSDIPIDRIV